MTDPSVNEEDKMILKEVAGMGIGHASSALEQLLHSKISITVPEIEITDLENMPQLFPDEKKYLGIVLKVLGDANGSMVFMFKEEDSKKMACLLNKMDMNSAECNEEIEIGTISEVSNMLSGAYLTAITKFADITLLPSIPQAKRGSAREIFALATINEPDAKLIIVKSELGIEGNKFEVVGSLILSLKKGEFQKLLDSIKKKYGV